MDPQSAQGSPATSEARSCSYFWSSKATCLSCRDSSIEFLADAWAACAAAPATQRTASLLPVEAMAVGVLLLLVWEVACWHLAVPDYIVPRPSVIATTLRLDLVILMKSLWVTMQITFMAFVLATLIGTLVAFVFVQSRWIEISFFPYAVLLQVTPIAAIAPLIIIWVKDTMLALTVCATIIALFPVIANTTLGLRSVNPGLASLFRMQRASKLQTLLRLQIPTALPYWFAGLRISSGLSLIGAVVAEFVAGTGGTGASTAFKLAIDMIEAEYDPAHYNGYLFYASDGENFTEDRSAAMAGLSKLTSLLNYVGYVETVPGTPRASETEMKMISSQLERDGAAIGNCVLNQPDDVWKAIRKFFVQEASRSEDA